MAGDHRAQLSIGALSIATSVPVETIRTWERRYGFPMAVRKPSGHRVYPLATVPRLRLIAQALSRGHRAAEVVPASESALEALLAAVPLTASVSSEATSRAPMAASDIDPVNLLDAVRAFDGERLKRSFQMEWARLGPLEFLERKAAPFLTGVGDAWAEGELEVRHEHFASVGLGDFLRSVRMPLDDRATGPIAALATLPGELHGLGVHMAAIVFALAGWRALVLGVDTPVLQLAALSREIPIAAAAISCAPPRRRKTTASLLALRRRLARHVPLLVGGSGAPREVAHGGIEIMPDLPALDQWLRDRAAG